jgi:hypothetical protein
MILCHEIDFSASGLALMMRWFASMYSKQELFLF